MCSTEANLEVVEVPMFLAGSYSEIWGCLFYSVNILKVTRQMQEIWLSHNWIESQLESHPVDLATGYPCHP